VGGDETKLILSLDGSIKETLHQLEGLLLVSQHTTAIDALEVEVEVAILETGVDHAVNLTGILGEEQAVVDGLHVVDGDLLAHPLNGLRGVKDGSHGVLWYCDVNCDDAFQRSEEGQMIVSLGLEQKKRRSGHSII
jgi:hypothetical protein